MSVHVLPDSQWFFGRVTSVTAELYVRIAPGETESRSARIHATVAGPRSVHARTLETSVPLTPVDGDKTLWRATLEDPCFWTPRQPYLYTARLTAEVADGRREEFALPLGVPVLVVRENRLELEGRNWTVRVIRGDNHEQAVLSACHESGTSLYVEQPADALCEMASREGVLLVADLTTTAADRVAAELRRLARWPAVGIVILPDAAEVDPVLRQETSHVIRAQAWPSPDAGGPRDWARLLIVDRQAVARFDRSPLPGLAIVVRSGRSIPDDSSTKIADSRNEWSAQVALDRQACDSLQAELAGRGEFAGYLMG